MSTPQLSDFDPAGQALIRALLAQASAKKAPIATPARPVVVGAPRA
jgi:hypothetical protein